MHGAINNIRSKLLMLVLILSFLPLSANTCIGLTRTLRVVTSIAPLADFARQVGKDRVAVTLLLPPGASPHTYEPTPRTITSITKADLFITIGSGLEFWADRLMTALDDSVTVITFTDMQKAFPDDPHIWLDPLISIEMIHKMREAFSKKDPEHASVYRQQAADFIKRLRSLDKEIAERVGAFRTRSFVTFHNAWAFFARRYDLRIAGVIEEGPGKEPTARHLDHILDKLKRMDIRVIFAEPQFNPRVAEAVAREAGGTVLILDPIGGQIDRVTYIDMMRYNLQVMEQVMK
jgi:zinc transport system substrate-binding protein